MREYVRDVPASQWQDWFNGPVQAVFQQHGFFDPAGVFLGDGSYLFVPDNPAYEGSVVLWFDEHNHPVNYEELSPAQRLPWQEWIVPAPAPAPSVKRPAVIERRERQRQETLVQRQAQAPPPDPATVITARELCPIKGFQWAEARVP